MVWLITAVPAPVCAKHLHFCFVTRAGSGAERGCAWGTSSLLCLLSALLLPWPRGILSLLWEQQLLPLLVLLERLGALLKSQKGLFGCINSWFLHTTPSTAMDSHQPQCHQWKCSQDFPWIWGNFLLKSTKNTRKPPRSGIPAASEGCAELWLWWVFISEQMQEMFSLLLCFGKFFRSHEGQTRLFSRMQIRVVCTGFNSIPWIRRRNS